jgi:hypothetical protein
MEIQTKYGMNLNPEDIESLRNMILHDSFFLEISGVCIRVVKVVGGLLYIIKNNSPTFVSLWG